MASDFDVKKDAKGEWYWILNAANGEPLARSTDGYKNRQDCLHCIKLVHDLSRTPEVWDLSVSGKATRVPASDIK
jgi:uncharacterized protein YegP (UPF0339 family)